MSIFQKISSALLLLISIALFSGCGQSETTSPTVKDITDAVFSSGSIVYEDEYWVTAVTEGFILNSQIKEGDQVIEGQALFQLSHEIQSFQSDNARVNYKDALAQANPKSPQIAQLKEQITQAKKVLDHDQKNYQRYAKLIESNAVSQLEHDKVKLQFENSGSNLDVLQKSLADLKAKMKLQVKNAKNKLDIQNQYFGDYSLSSSMPGVVLEISKNTGELARKGEMLARIGGGKLLAELYVAEEDINLIKRGQKAMVSLNTDPENLYLAQVSKIYPAFDEKEQSFIIQMSFSEAVPQLRSGTQVQANIIIEERKNAIVIPSSYLLQKNTVLLKNQEEVSIEVGVKNSEWTEVLKGIDEKSVLLLPETK